MKPLLALSLTIAACSGTPGDGAAIPDETIPAKAESVPAVAESVPAPAESVPRPAESVVVEAIPPLVERYDFDRRAARFDLPGRLEEVSGLAFAPDGRLFAHDDERARVHEIDPVTGAVGKRFDLGQQVVRDDFEGLAIVDDRFFLVSSLGRLYEFREGDDREELVYRVTDSGVGGDCEVEGLDYDPRDGVLLIACKTVTSQRASVVVHRLSLDPDLGLLPPLVVRKADLIPHGLDAEFDASAVAVSLDDTILLLSGRDDALIEVDRSGNVLSVVQLSKSRHPQSEGLALGPDGTIYVSDERADGKDARLTVYRRRGPERSSP